MQYRATVISSTWIRSLPYGLRNVAAIRAVRRRISLAIFTTLCTPLIGNIGCDVSSSRPLPKPDDVPVGSKFESPNTCGSCHPTHLKEWQGSIMHYAAASPVFNAFELTIQKITAGDVGPNGSQPNFCIQCHSPTGVFNNELPDYIDSDSAQPAFASLSPVSQEGLSCDFCHTVTSPKLEESLLGDGIANMSLNFQPSPIKVGPLEDPADNAYHTSVNSAFLQTSDFCGACHDVRLPVPDVITGEPFQRLENLFTEWQEGPYNSTDNPFGRVVRCQDCHMSLYPMEEPGTFPTMTLGTGFRNPQQKHAIHAFTAVSIPLLDDERFPNSSTDAVDDFGYPLGQQQRRTQMLQAACTLTLEGTPETLTNDAKTIPIRVVITNVGAGHRVPSGFSEERQMWVHLVVEDNTGIIYESGYLRDKAHPDTGEPIPDGLLHDEDLDDRHFEIELATFDTHFELGPDRNQRPTANLGIINFQNVFLRVHEDGTREPILNPLLANAIDNTHSLDMLKPMIVPYDVPVPERGIDGDIKVSATLRYRTFPPEFLRALAILEPELVSEEIVDKNTIVDMASAQTTITKR